MSTPSYSFPRNFCIGLVDGLTIPLALAAGLSNLVDSVQPVIIACLAVAVAGAITMGVGGYFESRKFSVEQNSLLAAATIGAGYFSGGLFVVLHYLITDVPSEGFHHAALHTLIVLLVAGYFESKLNGGSGWINAIRVCITAGVVSAAAYFIAQLFR